MHELQEFRTLKFKVKTISGDSSSYCVGRFCTNRHLGVWVSASSPYVLCLLSHCRLHLPVWCRLKDSRRLRKMSGSCSLGSQGSPSSTTVSRNSTNSAFKCSESTRTEIIILEVEDWITNSNPYYTIHTIVMIWHLLAHREDHGEHQRWVTHLLVLCKQQPWESQLQQEDWMDVPWSGATLHLECRSEGPGPVPWAGWSWAGLRWEQNSGCTLPRTPWAAAVAETHGAPAAAETTREKWGNDQAGFDLWPRVSAGFIYCEQETGDFYSHYTSEVCANKIVDLFCIAEQ